MRPLSVGSKLLTLCLLAALLLPVRPATAVWTATPPTGPTAADAQRLQRAGPDDGPHLGQRPADDLPL